MNVNKLLLSIQQYCIRLHCGEAPGIVPVVGGHQIIICNIRTFFLSWCKDEYQCWT